MSSRGRIIGSGWGLNCKVLDKEIGELEVDVEVEAFLRVVSVTLVGGPKWVGTSAFGRSDIFRQWMSTVVPIHFALAFNQSFVYQAARATG